VNRAMRGHVLVVRLDGMGDLLVCGPAIRAVAAHATRVSVLTGPEGADAARLLPGVDEVLVWRCPWIAADPPRIDASDISGVVSRVAVLGAERALILTSYHQSALPTALLLRLAGVAQVAAISDDYPGQLLDVRLPSPGDAPEPERMLAVARGAGFDLPAGDDGRLMLRAPLLPPPALPHRPYVVVHPGTTAPARAYPPDRWADVVAALTTAGWSVLVTGGVDEVGLTARVAAGARLSGHARDCGGAFDLMALAAVLSRARVVVAANTGPAHLAAAVGTPVVSLFAPVVSATRWTPYGVPVARLGDQDAPCRGTRARACPVAGHPCLTGVAPDDVARAVDDLAGTGLEEVSA
jgi:ADP-heptose:LPS heptosyltransferase